MGHHHKAASCSAIPSFQSFTSVSTKSSTQAPSLNLFDLDYIKQQQHQQSNLKRSIAPSLSKSSSQHSIHSQQQQLFPLPSFCLYSKRALANEYAPESDIVQFLSPTSPALEERLPMFVGVLQSLFTVVNDMPFINEHDEDSDDAEEEDDDEDHENNNSQSDDDDDISHSHNDIDEVPFTIIGLNSMKLVIWNNMYDNNVDMDVYEKDLCLVVMVSSQIPDNTILENMRLLRESAISSSSTTATTATANQMGEQLIPLIEYWFDTQ